MGRRNWNNEQGDQYQGSQDQGNYNQDQGSYNNQYQGQQGQGGYNQYSASQWNQPPSQWDQGQRQQWNQQVGSVPPQQFHQAVTQAAQQVDPQEYQNHFQSQPIANLPQSQQTGIAQTLISALLNHGANQQQISQNTGVSTLDPRKMSPQEIASVLQYAQQNHPQALGQVATQYQNQPDILHSVLGNKALLAVAATAGLGLLSGQIGKK